MVSNSYPEHSAFSDPKHIFEHICVFVCTANISSPLPPIKYMYVYIYIYIYIYIFLQLLRRGERAELHEGLGPLHAGHLDEPVISIARCVCMYMCMYDIYIYIYIYICIHIHTHMYTHTHTHTRVCTYVCMSLNILMISLTSSSPIVYHYSLLVYHIIIVV